MWTILPVLKCYGCKTLNRVGVVLFGLDVPKNPVFMRVSGLGTFWTTVFATLFFKNVFSGRWNSPPWFATKPKNRINFKAFALLWAEAFFMRLFWLPAGTVFRFLGWCSLCIYHNSRFVSFTFVEARAIFSLKGVTAMDQEKIGSFLAENRKAKGFTQIEFAEKLGVSNKSVSRWETGKNMPDVSLFLPICDALDISCLLYTSDAADDVSWV